MVKRMMYIAAVMTLLSAVVVSARQLSVKPTGIGVCRGMCSDTVACTGPCFCNRTGPAAGACTKDPI